MDEADAALRILQGGARMTAPRWSSGAVADGRPIVDGDGTVPQLVDRPTYGNFDARVAFETARHEQHRVQRAPNLVVQEAYGSG